MTNQIRNPKSETNPKFKKEKFSTPALGEFWALNAAVRGHPEYRSDDIRLNSQRIQIQAARVAAHIEKLLQR